MSLFWYLLIPNTIVGGNVRAATTSCTLPGTHVAPPSRWSPSLATFGTICVTVHVPEQHLVPERTDCVSLRPAEESGASSVPP